LAPANHVPGTVKVQIFGQIYSIAGDLDAAYVQKLAAYVDEKMRAIADSTSTIDTQKAAVLAALAIADELHNGLRERHEREQLLPEQAGRCRPLVTRPVKQPACLDPSVGPGGGAQIIFPACRNRPGRKRHCRRNRKTAGAVRRRFAYGIHVDDLCSGRRLGAA